MTTMAGRVVIGPSSFAERDQGPMRRLRAAGLEVIDNPFKRRLSRDEVMSLLGPQVVGIIAGLEPLDEPVLSASRLKVVSRVGSGMANVDMVAARRLGIRVYGTPTGPVEAVAEMTVGALLALARSIPAMDSALHVGKWDKRIGIQIEGKTVALIGYGRIGRRVAELLVPFRVTILVVDPGLPTSGAGSHAVLPLADALPQADIVSLHCSGEDMLLTADQLGRMKAGSILLNAARGGLVDEAALALALKSGRIAGAWLDAFTSEPYHGELATLPNVLLTPHAASYTEECRSGMEHEAVDNLLKGLAEVST